MNVTESNNNGITMTRYVERVDANQTLVNQILGEFNLTPKGDYSVPEEGRIASNIIIDTHEKGEVMLRLYPAGCQDSKLESGFVEFEIESLHYLSKNGIPVPSPICRDGQNPVLQLNDTLIFAYQLLPGKCLEQSDLSAEVAKDCGILLRNMLKVAEQYQPTDGQKLPAGDLKYIAKIYNSLLEKYPHLQNDPSLKEMLAHTTKSELQERLAKTPKGIVHADFFAENILVDSKNLAVIDFGDAYYGHTIMDIVIGAMEFCVLEDESWDMDMFSAFINENKEWLQKNEIDFNFFHDLLKANCLRFAIYVSEGCPAAENPYIRRYDQLKDQKLIDQLEKAYNV